MATPAQSRLRDVSVRTGMALGAVPNTAAELQVLPAERPGYRQRTGGRRPAVPPPASPTSRRALCTNDLLAVGLRQSCTMGGVRVPEELAPVGDGPDPFGRRQVVVEPGLVVRAASSAARAKPPEE